MLIAEALHASWTQRLDRLDAQMLLLHVLGHSSAGRAWLAAHGTDALEPSVAAQFQAVCQRRLAGEPLAYITGSKEFFGLALAVDARVLDPRADTETLVEWALQVGGQTVLDLGTGSGAIALALAHAWRGRTPLVSLCATDASTDALAVATANAARHQLGVEFVHGDWFAPLAGRRFDLIVSNPPYIAAQDPHLAALCHEPINALASGADGLADIRQIIHSAPSHLQPAGWLLLEHGHDQAEAVRALLVQAGFTKVQSRRDLAGIERCSGGQAPSPGADAKSSA